MNGNLLLGVLLFVVWLFVGTYWWACPLWENCPDEPTAQMKADTPDPATPTQTVLTAQNPMFNWGKSLFQPNADFNRYRDSVQGLLKNNYQLLEVTGQYFAQEPNGPQLGLARARQMRNLLMKGANGLDSTRFRLTSALREGPVDSTGSYFNAVRFGISVPKVFELEGEDFLIFFPTGSNQKVQDPAYEQRLAQAAEYLKQSRRLVTLTGHADKSGDTKANEILAQQRAYSIRENLIARGVSSSQISVRSEGDTQPLNPDNLTAQENRRVEVHFPNAN